MTVHVRTSVFGIADPDQRHVALETLTTLIHDVHLGPPVILVAICGARKDESLTFIDGCYDLAESMGLVL